MIIKKLNSEIEKSRPDFSCRIENKWFTDKCKIKRLEFYKCLNLYRQNKTEINCKAYTQARSIYKIAVSNAKYEYAKRLNGKNGMKQKEKSRRSTGKC